MTGSEEVDGAAAGAQQGNAEETISEPAAEQPLVADGTVAATLEAELEPATPVDLFVNSLSNEVDDVAKEEGDAAATPIDTSPGERKVDDNTMENAPPLAANEDILLNFGSAAGGSAEASEPSNDLDLLGFGPAETVAPPSHLMDVFGDSPAFNTRPASEPGPMDDLLGMSSGENTGIGEEAPSEPQTTNALGLANDEKEEIDGSAAKTSKEVTTSSDDINPPSGANENIDKDDLGSDNAQEDAPVEPENATVSGLAGAEVEEAVEPAIADKKMDADSNDEDPAPVSSEVTNADNVGSSIASEGASAELENSSELGQADKEKEEVNEPVSNQSSSEDDIAVEGTVVAEEKAVESNKAGNVEGIPQPAEAMEAFSDPQPTMVDIPKSTGETDSTPPAAEKVEEPAEERTQEEEEWLSMGLGLGDALRQIVALTEERDSALVICQEKDNGKIQAESVLVEVQSRLEAEMNRRAESESKVRQMCETLKTYEERLAAYEKMEDDLEQAQANLVTVVSEKSKIELEVQKLREIRDESEQKEVVLSNRLNEAKKKEANKSTAAGRLEADNEQLRDDLKRVEEELETTTKAKNKLETTMEKLKTKAVERVKQAETALAEERELNEERKKKMKVFVETKADELREAKESANDMQKELEETRASLRSSRDREEAAQKELDAARLKHREVQRDMERMKRNSEQLHKMGNSLEQELEKSASETEEHKKKRMSAKHEIMQMVRTLEVERAVSSKLKEGIKFTFTPKALSQQELLNEALKDFEVELERLSAKTGKALLPSPESTDHSRMPEGPETPDSNGAARKSKKTRSKADLDTERLISNLEQETQHVSKGIMALSGSIERMRTLLNDDNAFGCMTYLSNILAGTGEARHQRLDAEEAHEERHSSDQFV